MKWECFILPHGRDRSIFVTVPYHQGAVYTSGWRSVTLSASSSLGKSRVTLANPWFSIALCLQLQGVTQLSMDRRTNSVNKFNHYLSSLWQDTCHINNETVLYEHPYNNIILKKSLYRWVYQENNYICENIFRQRLKIAIRVGLGLEAWFWVGRLKFRRSSLTDLPGRFGKLSVLGKTEVHV